VLRNDLGLVGTRHGCGAEQCGACHVLVDDAVRPSCQLAVDAAVDHEITTVEHPTHRVLAALRRAFIAEQAAQCGACSSGMLVTAVGLLACDPRPDEVAVRHALQGCLCRCGSHPRIVRAVVRAGEELHDE
jgi:aerobic-type carbon monoxide dehydrogenase small subunit (CoxS/CutS family)